MSAPVVLLAQVGRASAPTGRRHAAKRASTRRAMRRTAEPVVRNAIREKYANKVPVAAPSAVELPVSTYRTMTATAVPAGTRALTAIAAARETATAVLRVESLPLLPQGGAYKLRLSRP